ncbi:type I polyketide synthase [Actinocorallia aurea]
MTRAPEPSSRDGEAIAIVAMGCRYPGGVRSPRDLWRLVAEGVDAVAEAPASRGWGAALDGAPPRGGFLEDADRFDARFFGISPREADGMDPQQRVLLEVAWETFERAGLSRKALAGSGTGAFIGAMAQEYGPRMHEDNGALGGYRITGGSPSVLSGRIAYSFGLRGPAVTVDTACSSSLVALHLAVQALRQGECDLALAGGVAVMPTPGMFVDFARQGGLSPDGRCRSFSDDAAGTGWAEGAGLLLLARHGAAIARGLPVLALVKGTATNSDGASNGLTAPSREAQEDVVRRALAAAGLGPHDVDAVEAHGTGTELGDPIEARALAAVYGAGRAADAPLWLGSLKSNLGHAQAAAGVGGVIKMVEALRARTLPRTLHVSAPTRHVHWEGSGLALLTEARAWSPGDRPRRAAVSSFGISGTNAHTVLEEAPPPAAAPREAARGPLVWQVSAPDAAALRRQAGALHAAVTGDGAPAPEDVALTLRRRTRFAHRAAVVADDAAGLTAGLAALADGAPAPSASGKYGSPAVLRTERHPDPAGPVLVFPGQGAQWREMGLALMEESPVFRQAMRECAEELAPLWGRRLTDVLRSGALERTEIVQPALFAVMVSLARLWRAAGVRPSAVVGHSQGEIAAACVAGALSLADACRVVVLRSRALTALEGTGGMASVPLDARGTRELLGRVGGDLDLATLNGPRATVVGGDPADLGRLLALCEAEGVDARRVEVSYASHTGAVDRIEDEILDGLAGITPRTPSVPLHSTLTGTVVDGPAMDASYWFDNLRGTVRFAPVIADLVARRHRTFVEVSPHPVLTLGIQETLDDAGALGTVTGTLRKGSGGLGQFLTAAVALPDADDTLDLAPLQPAGAPVDLPVHRFAGARHWIEARPASASGLAGEPVDLPSGETVVAARLDPAARSWTADHVVGDGALVPGTLFLALLGEAGRRVGLPVVDDLVLGAALPLTGPLDLRLVLAAPDQAGGRAVTVHARGADGGWTQHATGVLSPAGLSAAPAVGASALVWPPRDATPVDVAGMYADLAERGYRYGPAFAGVRAAWTRGEEVFAEAVLPDAVGDLGDFAVAHPALLDATLHAALPHAGGGLAVPFAWRGVLAPPGGTQTLRAVLTARDGEFAVTWYDGEGRRAGHADALALRPLPGAEPAAARLALAFGAAPAAPPAEDWAALGGSSLGAPRVFAALEELPDPWPAHVVAEVRAPGGPDAAAAAETVLAGTVALLRSWTAARKDGARLTLVTRGALAASEREPIADLGAAAVVGAVRAAQAEHPDAFRIVDLDDAPASLAALPSALGSGEYELAIRAGRLLRPRLVPAPDTGFVPPEGPWRLDVTSRGTLDDLALVPHPEAAAALGPREVRLDVRAAGLNFRDVTVGLGLVDTERTMGAEGAGVVTETGSEVTGFHPGDRVFGVFARALGPVAVADERMIRPLPPGWSFTDGAGVPIVFITAYQCLVDEARTRPGDRVLVHTATGGVGLAALQIARHLGAEVFATASPAKHGTLRDHGLPDDHIASSRSLAFAEEFRAATGGRGVDVVLNSLSGKAVDASLGLLAGGGRFVEMGKTDLRPAAEVAAAHPGVGYGAYNILGVAPDRIGEVLDELIALFAAGALGHLPTRTWDVRQGKTPLRMLSRARHRGKLVLTMPRSLDPDRPVLITGGTGGLGALTARHLAETHGVRRLILLSRRGPAAPGARELAADLAALGADAHIAACDVTAPDALAALVAAHAPGAVFHTAGVLSDGLLTRMTPAKLRAAVRPKVRGAWLLHELTRDLDLSAFVLFSSAAGVIGSPGQANYAAANAFLDALAQHRRALGLEATSLAWGLWSQSTGMTGHLAEAQTAALARIGLAPMDGADGLALLDAALASPAALQAPLLPAPRGLRAGSRAGRLFGVPDPATAAPSATGHRPSEATDAPPADLMLLVRTQAAQVLGHPGPDAIDPDAEFKGLGFDSLLSVDLRNRINAAAGLRLPAGAVLDHPTPRDLVAYLTTTTEGKS